jgi:cytoskeletal protein RodZ
MNDVCTIIQEKRTEKLLTIKDIALALKIRKEYVIALENNDIDYFISKTYYYGYLKQYLRFLDIEDIYNNKETTKNITIDQELSIDIPTPERFSPNFLFTVIIIILGIIIYNFCNDFITKDINDPISSEINRKISQFVDLQSK